MDRFDRDAAMTVPGVTSIADVVDGRLPGGVEAATDAEILDAISATLERGAGTEYMRFTLSEQGSSSVDTNGIERFEAPAFTTKVVFDAASFDSNTAQEVWLREMQAEILIII